MFLVLGSLVCCCWLSPISNKEMDMKTQLGDVWILGMPFFRLLARRHRQMGGGFHFVNSWDVYLFSSSISCTIRASLIVFGRSNRCWRWGCSFFHVFPRYVGCALHLSSPYFHLCLRLLPHHFQPWEAGHAICKSRRGLRTQVPACARGWCLGFFFSKNMHRWINFIIQVSWVVATRTFFIFTPIRSLVKMMNPIWRSHIIFR